MTSHDPWLSIVGIGEDGLDGLSARARRLIGDAVLVVGGARHLALAAPAIRRDRLPWPSPPATAFDAILARRKHPVCVLASGDPFFHGIGSLLLEHVPWDEFESLPRPSAFSLVGSSLGWALQDCQQISLHGRRIERIIPLLQPKSRILALSWDGDTPRKLADLLTARGFGGSTIIVCEAMGGPREKRRAARADAFDLAGIDPLNTLAIEVEAGPEARVLPATAGLPDDWFEHDGQITKREVRAITLSALAPRRGDVLWDIGAGSGSIAIEWMLRDPRNRAIAIEARPDRTARIARNAAGFGVPGLELVEGAAPAALAGLAPPDAVFIGGAAGEAGLLERVWEALKPGGRLVVNAVTIETQAEVCRRFETLGGELTAIQIARAGPVGQFHGWRPNMPIVQWAVTKS